MKIGIREDGSLDFPNGEKKLKGYQYDSLVYRYIRAREKMAEYDAMIDPKHDRYRYNQQANRDILNFCEILDEVIGEHD